jgi:hypothetical protein
VIHTARRAGPAAGSAAPTIAGPDRNLPPATLAAAAEEVRLARMVSTTVTINAAPADVWAVLCDLDCYPEWHPDIRQAAGHMQAGDRVVFKMAPPGRRPFTIRPRVTVARPGTELRLLARLPVVFGGEHSFALSPIDADTRTEVVQSEIYRGLVVPFIGKTIAATQIEFEEVNQALKRRVEQDRGIA